MKRIAVAILLLVSAVSVTLWTGHIFEKEMIRFEEELNNLVKISENASQEKLIEEAEKIVLQWNNSSGLLRSVVLHDGVDELGRGITSLPQIIKCSGKDEMVIKCIEAINMIKNLKICEKISFENIL